jgi:hypothetical protein
VQAEDLKFRQTPTFADCFPGSTKEYTTVEFNGESIKVIPALGCHCDTIDVVAAE